MKTCLLKWRPSSRRFTAAGAPCTLSTQKLHTQITKYKQVVRIALPSVPHSHIYHQFELQYKCAPQSCSSRFEYKQCSK